MDQACKIAKATPKGADQLVRRVSGEAPEAYLVAPKDPDGGEVGQMKGDAEDQDEGLDGRQGATHFLVGDRDREGQEVDEGNRVLNRYHRVALVRRDAGCATSKIGDRERAGNRPRGQIDSAD